MACDLCNCEDHHNQPCALCMNCIGHHELTADWDQDHTDYTQESTDVTQNLTAVHTKPRYKYNAKTGEIREVTDIVREAFGL